MLFLFLKFNIIVVRILVVSAPAGWKEYLLYQGSLPPGICKHFLASGIFLRASHIPEAVNEVAKHINDQHILNIQQTVQMAEQTRDMTEISELHYPMKSRTLDRRVLGVLLVPWELGQDSGQRRKSAQEGKIPSRRWRSPRRNMVKPQEAACQSCTRGFALWSVPDWEGIAAGQGALAGILSLLWYWRRASTQGTNYLQGTEQAELGSLPETLLSLGDSSCTTIQEERELAEKHIKVWELQTTPTMTL